MLNNGNVFLKKGDLKTSIGLLVSFVVIIFLNWLYQNWAIKEYNETYAIYIGTTGGVGDGAKYFKYKSNKNVYIEAGDKFRFKTPIKIGDTVWIKYSKYDNDIIQVIDADYKRHLKKTHSYE